ncbi:MAG TPA: HEAT repeat domain-containing protein, partial [Rhodocyclaceae bacterium]
MADSAVLARLAGYLYWPDALRKAQAGSSQADRFHVLLMNGALPEVRGAIADRPELLADLLPIIANPEASINVRLGASVIFEEQAGGPALRALVGRLVELAAHADARVRADACFYLGLSGAAEARTCLQARVQDQDAEVREIAIDALAAL